MRRAAIILLAILSLACCSQRPTVLHVFPRDKTRDVNGTPIALELLNLAMVMDSTIDRKTPIPVMLDHGKGPHGESAVGWLTECEIRNSGLWCYFNWTQFGREATCRGQWRFVSPRFRASKVEGSIGEYPTELVEVSLVNLPALEGMAPVEIPPCTARPFGNLVERDPIPPQERHKAP